MISHSYYARVIYILLAISLSLNNVVVGFKIGGVSVDRIFQFLIFFLLYKTWANDLVLNRSLRHYFMFIVTLVILFSVNQFSLIVQGDSVAFAEVFRRVVRILSYGVYLYLAYFLYLRLTNSIQVIILVFCVVFLLAFFQSPLTPLTEWSQQARMTYFSSNMKGLDLYIYDLFLNDSGRDLMRVSGPYGQPITLSYSLVASAILVAFMYLRTSKYLYLTVLLYFLLVSAMSLTRSSTIGIAVLIIYCVWQIRSRWSIWVGILVLMAVVYVYMPQWGERLGMFDRLVTSDSSSGGKLHLIITGLYALITNPFGVSEAGYLKAQQDMYAIFSNPDILKYSPHNGIVNLGFEYGVLVYLPFVIYLNKLKSLSVFLVRKERRFWAVASLVYVFHQSFHNNGIFYVDFNILLVLALYYARVVRRANSKHTVNS